MTEANGRYSRWEMDTAQRLTRVEEGLSGLKEGQERIEEAIENLELPRANGRRSQAAAGAGGAVGIVAILEAVKAWLGSQAP